jgi:hypothetical protein
MSKPMKKQSESGNKLSWCLDLPYFLNLKMEAMRYSEKPELHGVTTQNMQSRNVGCQQPVKE